MQYPHPVPFIKKYRIPHYDAIKKNDTEQNFTKKWPIMEQFAISR